MIVQAMASPMGLDHRGSLSLATFGAAAGKLRWLRGRVLAAGPEAGLG